MNRPSFFESHLNRGSFDTSFFDPITKVHGAALVCNHVSPRTVSGLARPSSPKNVIGFVITIVVDAANRMLRRWGASNIFKKCLERMEPTITNLYASATIAGVSIHRGILATADHAVPSSPFLRAMRFAVAIHRMIFASGIGSSTTATIRSTHEQRVGFDRTLNATLATAQIPASSMFISDRSWGFLDDSPATKLLTYHNVSISRVF